MFNRFFSPPVARCCLPERDSSFVPIWGDCDRWVGDEGYSERGVGGNYS